MTLFAWLSLALNVCWARCLGPGLAIVVRRSCSGTRAGAICALSHGFGIFLWAALMVSGRVRCSWPSQPGLTVCVFWWFCFICCRALMAQRELRRYRSGEQRRREAAREGLVIALSNPKVAVFAALFSQFIRPGTTLSAQP